MTTGSRPIDLLLLAIGAVLALIVSSTEPTPPAEDEWIFVPVTEPTPAPAPASPFIA